MSRPPLAPNQLRRIEPEPINAASVIASYAGRAHEDSLTIQLIYFHLLDSRPDLAERYLSYMRRTSNAVQATFQMTTQAKQDLAAVMSVPGVQTLIRHYAGQ